MPEIGEVRACRLCGKEYTVRASTQVYCCRKCANDAYNAGIVQKRHGKHDDLTEETMAKRARREIKKAKKVWRPVEKELKHGAAYRDIQLEETLRIQKQEMEARRNEKEGHRHG